MRRAVGRLVRLLQGTIGVPRGIETFNGCDEFGEADGLGTEVVHARFEARIAAFLHHVGSHGYDAWRRQQGAFAA